jgi:S-adenosylmethionine:tRNA ribosyltransferase-isomerase
VADDQRYQTVYARQPGSAAAPTAGLHLTRDLLDRIEDAGASVAAIQLDVGLATFRPIASDDIADHTMHTERYRIASEVWDRVGAARRVVAIGTTTVRALESAAATGVLDGESSLFITPGFDWRVVDVLMTNFHLPRSSLLVLVEAFVGSRWRALYTEALARDYRFLSFGDTMLLERSP